MAEARSEAIEALSKMAKAGDRGDQVAIASVSRFLTHSDPDCRAAAVFALTKATLTKCCRSPHVTAWQQVARAGDQAVVSALSPAPRDFRLKLPRDSRKTWEDFSLRSVLGERLRCGPTLCCTGPGSTSPPKSI